MCIIQSIKERRRKNCYNCGLTKEQNKNCRQVLRALKCKTRLRENRICCYDNSSKTRHHPKAYRPSEHVRSRLLSICKQLTVWCRSTLGLHLPVYLKKPKMERKSEKMKLIIIMRWLQKIYIFKNGFSSQISIWKVQS